VCVNMQYYYYTCSSGMLVLSIFTYLLDVKSDSSTTRALNVGLSSGVTSQHFCINSYLCDVVNRD